MSARPRSVTCATLDRLAARIHHSESDETIRPLAPYSLEPIAELPCSTAADVADAVAHARATQAAWVSRPIRDRARLALRFHDLLLARRNDILDLLQLEAGKARIHALLEVLAVAGVARHYARRGAHYLRQSAHRGAIPGLTRVREVRVPRGVVGVVGPWNYPLFLSIGDALPALLAGNGVVIKADSQTPLSVLWAAELLEEAGAPPGLVQVVTGPGSVVGTALVDHADFVCFTGSTRTGRAVAQRAAARLIGCSLELGGKNPMVLCADADLAKAVDGAVQGCFTNAGQLCLSIERIYVHRDVHDDFVHRFTDRVRRLRLAQSYAFDSDMGTLVSTEQFKVVSKHVSDARSKGATVLAGGEARPDLGPLYYEPTVLTGVTPDMALFAEETFGPVVSIYPVDSEAEAVARANEGSYGLNASVWTRNTARGESLARRIVAGAVNINDGYGAAIGSTAAPMGGMRDSGLGRRQGGEGIRKYTEAQTIATQRLLPMPPHPAVPLRLNASVSAAAMAALRRLRVR